MLLIEIKKIASDLEEVKPKFSSKLNFEHHEMNNISQLTPSSFKLRLSFCTGTV